MWDNTEKTCPGQSVEVSRWQDYYILFVRSGNCIKAGAELDKELTAMGKPIQLLPSNGKRVKTQVLLLGNNNILKSLTFLLSSCNR